MQKILIRSGMSPLDAFSADKVIKHNSIGGNVGNLIYQFGVIRTIMTENIEIIPDYYNYDYSQERADFINKEYAAYVIPLADAFRKQFISELRNYTKLIKKLTIPVYVVGVGLRAPLEPNLEEGFSFDEDAKAFVSAVLEKSTIIGVRGQITADYLSRLGFKEGKDHMVIGCPSMYSFGRELNIREPKLTKDSLISINSSKLSPDNVLEFINRTMTQYSDHYFIPQWMKELELVYTGKIQIGDKHPYYPTNMKDSVYLNDRVRYFLNAKSWIDFLKGVELSVGARLHGNITATIAGTPSILLVKDARMRELAEYHQLTYITSQDIDENTNLDEIVKTLDFKKPERMQAENFDRFIGFLDKNGIEHIYQDTLNPEVAPLDLALENTNSLPPLKTIAGVTVEEMVDRWEKYDEIKGKKLKASSSKRENKLQNKLKKVEKENKKCKKQLSHANKTLNRKSVRFSLKLADSLARIKK